MVFERVLCGLQAQTGSTKRAQELANMAMMQWLGTLPGNMAYPEAVARAQEAARPFRHRYAPVAIFCQLLTESLKGPMHPLGLRLPQKGRRGGARARREML